MARQRKRSPEGILKKKEILKARQKKKKTLIKSHKKEVQHYLAGRGRGSKSKE
jgi:hypothetical protein